MSGLNYLTEAKGRDWSCSACGWKGSLNETATEFFSELFETNCPACDSRLATVLYPSRQDVRAAAVAGDTEAQSMVNQVIIEEELRKDQEEVDDTG